METAQTRFWESEFGRNYTDRNAYDPAAWNKLYHESFGTSKDDLNRQFLDHLDRKLNILEVGCNIGQQLLSLQRIGFENLYGIEIQSYAIQKAKQNSIEINIIKGSGFDIPFKDGLFDLVFTNGVLIHINPNDLPIIMREIYRVSKKYIWGFEYFSKEEIQLDYRGNKGFLWKADYCEIFRKNHSDLKIIKKQFFPYLTELERGNVDCMYLLSK